MANPQTLLRKKYPVLTALFDGPKASLNKTWNFFKPGGDAYKADTYKQGVLFIEEIALSSSPVSDIYKPHTPKLDAMVDNMDRELLKGDTYSRTKYLSESGTDLLTAWAGNKGLGAIKSSAIGIAISTIAESFYAKVGYTAERASQHMQGIDFSKPVQSTTLKKGTVVQQWVGENGMGNYITPLENGAAQNLGIPDYTNRTLKQFTLTEDIKVLKSTAGDLNGAKGGGTQYFSPEIKNKITPTTSGQ